MVHRLWLKTDMIYTFVQNPSIKLTEVYIKLRFFFKKKKIKKKVLKWFFFNYFNILTFLIV
jgi:hypothetical protein